MLNFNRRPSSGGPVAEPTAVHRSAEPVRRVAAAYDTTPQTVLCAALSVLACRYRQSWLLRLPDGDLVADEYWQAAEGPFTGLLAAVEAAVRPLDAETHLAGADTVVTVGRSPGSTPAEDVDLSLTWEPELVLRAPEAGFDAGTLEQVAGHLDRLLEQLDGRDAELAQLSLLTGAEDAFLAEHSGTVPDYDPVTLHGLFSAQAARTPHTEALREGDRSLTYRQLDNASNVLARRLARLGAGPERAVAVTGLRGLELFTALLAVLKSGAAIVYLDPEYPEAYHAAVLEAAGSRLVVVAPGGHTPAVEDRRLTVVRLENAPAQADHDSAAPPDRAGFEDPAYIIFTSGTTGAPKGVVRPHRMHVTRIALEQSMYGLGPGDRILLKSPISFREFLWPLAVGATAVVARSGGERDDRYLIPLMREQAITVVSFVPSMLRVLDANPQFAQLSGSLRHIFAGGEKLPADLEERLRAAGFQVHNTYTLTEADYVLHRREATATRGQGSVVGRPLDMRIHLVDRAGRLVPPGVTGEILTGGPGLATGYLGRPDLTAERFVPNPFDTQVPLLFRTGDLARFLPDGQLDYIGRADLQVKVRGQRVEPTAVEAVLREHPGVADAVCVGYPDEEQGGRLVAFVKPVAAPVPVEEFAAFLHRRMPAFMVPASFVWLDAFPLLLSGKVDRASLVPAPGVRPELQTPYAAPGSPVEVRLAAVWQRVLGVTGIGLDDRFSLLGGDSLRVLVLRSLIEQEFHTAIETADLFDHPTIRAQSRLLDGRRPHAPGLPPRRDRRQAATAERLRRAGLAAAGNPTVEDS